MAGAIVDMIGLAILSKSFATYWDLAWVLDDAQQQQLLALPPGAYDDDR